MALFMPAVSFRDLANRWRGDAKLFAKSALRSSWAICNALTNVSDLLPGQFGRAAFLAILHRAVTAHIHLVLAMSCPAEIVDAVISRIPIVVRHIGLALCWRRQVRQSNGAMSRDHFPNARIRDERCSAIAQLIDGRAHKNGGVSPIPVRISPLTFLATPTAQLAKFGRFVHRKAGNRFPHGWVLS